MHRGLRGIGWITEEAYFYFFAGMGHVLFPDLLAHLSSCRTSELLTRLAS